MPNTYVTYTGDGSTQDFTITFPFLRSSHVTAKINDVLTTDYSISGTTLTFDTAPANGAEVELRRVTPTGALVRRFYDGPNPTGTELEEAFKQAIYAIQDLSEGTIAITGIELPEHSVGLDRIETIDSGSFLARSSSGNGSTEEVGKTAAKALLDVDDIETDLGTAENNITALEQKPVVVGYISSAQTINASTATVVNFVKSTDTNTIFSDTTHQVTPNVAGYYHVYASVTFTAAEVGKYYRVYIRRNGSFIQNGTRVYAPTTDPITLQVSDTLRANGTTDYFDVVVEHDSATSKTLSNSESKLNCNWERQYTP